MAAKTGWHRYGTKLRHGHRMYKQQFAAVYLPVAFTGYDQSGVTVGLSAPGEGPVKCVPSNLPISSGRK